MENRTVKIPRQITASPKNIDKQKATGYLALEKPPKTPNSNRTLRIPEMVMDEQERILGFMNDSFVPEGGSKKNHNRQSGEWNLYR